MNYKKGILIYDFSNLDRVNEVNIGDYVQTIAALNLVQDSWKDKIYINREELNKDIPGLSGKEKVKLIANGWFVHNQNTWPINKKILPLFTSVHISKGFNFNEKSISELKKFQPIGCRDLDSKRRLNENGIEAYFSGCLTMSFKKREKNRSGILFIIDNIKIENNVPFSNYKKGGIQTYDDFVKWRGSKYIIKILSKSYNPEEIRQAEFLTQFSDKNLTIEQQFINAEKWLDKLSSKELVVTTRIHSLMPAMAMGTPAIFIMINNLDLRFKGLMKYWNIIDFSNNKAFNARSHTQFSFFDKPIKTKIKYKKRK